MGLLQNASLIVTPNAYKAGKLYSVVPSDGTGDFTVTRATSATKVNSLGLIETVGINVPRLDYTNASCPSILVETQRTNLALRSDMFANTYWTKGNFSTISANIAISPSGIQDADKHIAPNPTGQAYALVNGSASITISTSYTFSVFVKISEVRYIQLRNNFNGNCFCNFDLQTGTIGIPSANTTANIINYGNGWYRCSITVTASSTTSSGVFGTNMCNSLIDNLAPLYSGNPGNGYFVWGAQLELGGNATSYIPTTTATVTRNADIINRDNIYTNGLITNAGGTMFIELKNNIPVISSISSEFNFGIGSSNNGYGSGGSLSFWNFTSSSSRLQIIKNVGGTFSTLYTSTTDNCKIAIKWNGSTADIFENGVKVVNATLFNTTNMNFLYGSGARRSFLLDKMFLFPTPLTDSECISLTTL